MEKKWAKIFTTSQHHLAEILKGNLEENGIDCIVINKQGSPYNFLGDIELYVHQNNVLMAIKIIKENNS